MIIVLLVFVSDSWWKVRKFHNNREPFVPLFWDNNSIKCSPVVILYVFYPWKGKKYKMNIFEGDRGSWKWWFCLLNCLLQCVINLKYFSDTFKDIAGGGEMAWGWIHNEKKGRIPGERKVSQNQLLCSNMCKCAMRCIFFANQGCFEIPSVAYFCLVFPSLPGGNWNFGKNSNDRNALGSFIHEVPLHWGNEVVLEFC